MNDDPPLFNDGFNASLLAAIRATLNLPGDELQPGRKPGSTNHVNDTRLGRNGVTPQSQMRGVSWVWDRNHRHGRWMVKDLEHNKNKYFEGTVAGRQEAETYAANRVFKRKRAS